MHGQEKHRPAPGLSGPALPWHVEASIIRFRLTNYAESSDKASFINDVMQGGGMGVRHIVTQGHKAWVKGV